MKFVLNKNSCNGQLGMTHSFIEECLQDCSPREAFSPVAFYNKDGDCIEFFASDEQYFAERVDHNLTVFYGESSGELVGSMIKGISSLVKEMPNIQIDVYDGKIKLSHIIRATAYNAKSQEEIVGRDEDACLVYRKLKDKAEESNIDMEAHSLLLSCP